MRIDKYLDDILKIDSKIANKTYEVIMWKDIAKGSTGRLDGDRVQSSGSKQKMAEAVGKYTDIEAEIEELKQMKVDFIQFIEKLDKQDYMLMHDIYIKGFTVTETARMQGHKDSWGSTRHKRAKERLNKIIWGGEDG